MSKQIQQEGYGKSTPAKHLKASRFPKAGSLGPSVFLPSELEGLQLWCKYNSGITVSGLGVSQWDDVSGNGNHLKQGTDTNRPSKEGDGSILFNGSDNLLKTDAFTLAQPTSVYMLFKQVTWTADRFIFDGVDSNKGTVFQQTTTPRIKANAGGGGPAQSDDLALDTYGIVTVIFNGASSLLKVDNNSDITFDAGANDMGGFTLGMAGGSVLPSNIQVKEVVIFSTAHDSSTRAQMIAYLADVGGLSI